MNAQFLVEPELDFGHLLKKRPAWLAWLFGELAVRQTVRLKGPLVYRSHYLKKWVTINAPYRSDGASVPQVFWNIFPPFGDYLLAAIIHDYFCDLGHEDKSPINWLVAARLFLEAMTACHAKLANQSIKPPSLVVKIRRWTRRHAMFLAVICAGPRFRANKNTTLSPLTD